VESELLSTYAVDLLPKERVSKSLKIAHPHAPLTAERAAVAAIRVVGFIFQLYIFLIVATWVIAIVVAILAAVVGPLLPDDPSSTLPVTPVVSYPVTLAPEVRIRSAPPWRTPPPVRSPAVNPFMPPKEITDGDR
jgi:hypothetical protein